MPPQFLENMVILCFERRFSKQNSVIRLISNILPPSKFPPKIFGLATTLALMHLSLGRPDVKTKVCCIGNRNFGTEEGNVCIGRVKADVNVRRPET